MTEPRRITVLSEDVRLNVFVLGRATAPPLVMLHGIRDVAWSLMPIADALANDFLVVLPDLRGHGDSDNPGQYASWHFVYDLHRVLEEVAVAPALLFGHSLGGQIVTHYAALFPAKVRGLVLAEGFGPPLRPADTDPAQHWRAQAERLVSAMSLPERSRPLPSVEFAAQRLLANNPRLSPTVARALAERCTYLDDSGDRHWKFDQRASQIWLGVDLQANRERWRALTAPTLVITGALAHEHWQRQMPIPGWSGRFTDDDLADRLACFRKAASRASRRRRPHAAVRCSGQTRVVDSRVRRYPVA